MGPLTRHEVTGSAETAAVAEVAYRLPDGRPTLLPVTPLSLDGDPAFTLTYADSEVARGLAASPEVRLVFSDSRLAYVGWTPLSVAAVAEVVPDPDGDLYRDALLHQELRKFPPARDLIGSMMLQRENWWYLARWVVRLVGADRPAPIARRETEDHAILACAPDGLLEAHAARATSLGANRIPVERPGGSDAPLPEGPAALLLHDFATPDMDPRTSFLAAGRFENGRLLVDRRSGSPELGKRPGLIARWREQRDLERRCKAGLKEYA